MITYLDPGIMKNEKVSTKMNNLGKAGFKTIVMLLIFFSGLLSSKFAQAQINVSVNIVSQPLWGPVGYDYVDYYYLPEAEVYYYVPQRRFFYISSGRWVYSPYLPTFYHIDLFSTYKIVINEPRPYLRHKVYFAKYGKYKNYKGKQVIIRNSNDKKYYVVKGHPKAAKVKATKPKNTKAKSTTPRSSKGSSAKPQSSRGSNAKPSASHEKSSHQNSVKPGGGSKGNSSKGNDSKGKGGKGR